MNTTLYPNNLSNASGNNPDGHLPVPDTSMLPGSEKAPPPAVDLLKSAVQGAHATIDRLADRAAPAVQHMGQSVAAAQDALQAKAHELRETRDAWAEDLRTTVRGNPLAAVAAAFVVGLVIARLTH